MIIIKNINDTITSIHSDISNMHISDCHHDDISDCDDANCRLVYSNQFTKNVWKPG